MISLRSPSTSSSPSPAPPKANPNIVPFRIGHDGPINMPERYWNPATITTTSTVVTEGPESGSCPRDSKIVYFRGRRLLGKDVPLHKDYRGVMVRMVEPGTNRSPAANDDASPAFEQGGHADGEGANDTEVEAMGFMDELASFDSVTVWSHDALPADDEPVIRGMQEWIGLAGAIHSYDLGQSP